MVAKIVKGGPMKSVSLNGRELKITADNDATITLGGYEVSQEMNGMGTHRELYMPIPWSASGLKVELDVDNNDHEYLVDFQNGGGGDVVVSYRNADYVGVGNITGTLEANPASASVTLNLGGGGKLKKL
jgi:hypothetical protein